MATERIIIDCYTDEPAGLGVPPFLGVWPRYLAGSYRDLPAYLTIDDLRAAALERKPTTTYIDPLAGKTKTQFLNTTRDYEETRELLRRCRQAIFVAGAHTPGKYLAAKPGTVREIINLSRRYRFRKILAGPAAAGGSQYTGGRRPEQADQRQFEQLRGRAFDTYEELRDYAVAGAAILGHIPHRRIVEIETGQGCPRGRGCSFCTEPLKGAPAWRAAEDVVAEMAACMQWGAAAFRLGRQSCLLSYRDGDVAALRRLLKGAAALHPAILHMDNASPGMVTDERIGLCAEFLTPGSTAAMGAESFDQEVIRQNNLNSTFEEVFEAVRTINRRGGTRGENGCHRILPGINIVLGLIGETRRTLDINYECLKKILDSGLLVRRINIRQVVPFPGTRLHELAGNKYLRKNRRYYRNWTRKIREEIDEPMLRRLFPKGTVLRGLYSEVHEGNVTFLRQLGSYPIVVGTRERLPLQRQYDIRVTGHNLRSLEGQVVETGNA